MKCIKQLVLIGAICLVSGLASVSFASTEAIVIDTTTSEVSATTEQEAEAEQILPSEANADTNESQSSEAETNEGEVEPILYNADGHPLIVSHNTTTPEDLKVALKYDKYLVGNDYIVLLNGPVNIRKGPSTSYNVIRRGQRYGKYKLIETVKGQYFKSSDTDEWHKIMYYSNGQALYGYVYSGIVAVRQYRFDAAYKKILDMDNMIHGENVAHISNYKNHNGYPPLYLGKHKEDDRAVLRYQAAPGYFEANLESGFRYLQDGRLLRVDGYDEMFYHVTTFDTKEHYYVPKKYLSFDSQLANLSQIIVVDLSNQNEIAFEKQEDGWAVVSYSYATSGTVSEHKEPTDPGVYKAIQKKDKFLYLDDKTKEIAGYAPFAIRFNGGAYIHGFPVNFRLIKEEIVEQEEILDEDGNVIQERITTEKIIDREDPGHIEYSGTLGTIPLSHKCIRNVTSHAKFLYEWIRIGEAVVIIEE